MSQLFTKLGSMLGKGLRGAGEVGATLSTGQTLSAFQKMPLMSRVGWGATGAVAGKELLLDPVLGAVEGAVEGGNRQNAAIGAEREVRDRMRGDRLRVERIRRDMAINTARLAQYNPELYNQLAFGPMPQGSTMLGGTPNFDVVDQVAAMMGRGDLK